jgi:hypothetical protein
MKYLYSLLILIIAVLSPLTQWYEALILSLSIVLILALLGKTGKGIALRESIAILYVLTCLIMPYIGYEYYTIKNPLSRLWVNYMVVPKEVYYNYALPAIACFCFALTLPLKNNKDEGHWLSKVIDRIKNGGEDIGRAGVAIMLLSVVSSIVTPFLPSGLQFFSNLFYFAGFAGFLYVYYAGKQKYKKVILLLFIVTIAGSALSQGMFTVVAYMGITIFSFFMLGNRTSMVKKILLFSSAILFFILLQNTKGAYRKYIWNSNYTDNKALLFSSLFVESLQKSETLLETNSFFPLYTRANQGFNVAIVMRRIPSSKPFDGGSRLSTVLASAFVPRFLWPDKPEAGGKFNMAYYAGRSIKGWSTNVGPLGEAYGSFGVLGGIFYMFVLGFFMRWCYLLVFRISDFKPIIICWIPVLFYQMTYSAETDTMAILNSIIKAAFFIWILMKILPHWFKIQSTKYAVPPERTVFSNPGQGYLLSK